MRAAFSDTLVRLAKADPNVLLLTGDSGGSAAGDKRYRFLPGKCKKVCKSSIKNDETLKH